MTSIDGSPFKWLIILFLFTSEAGIAQRTYQHEKPGGRYFSDNVNSCDGVFDRDAVSASFATIAGWLHHNHPLMSYIKGFDAFVNTNAYCYGANKPKEFDYAIPGEVYTGFRLFYIENGKELRWNIEPPSYSIWINSIYYGHNAFSRFNVEGYRSQDDSRTLKPALDKAVEFLSSYFHVPATERMIGPGIMLYKDGNIIISDPTRPEYWIPVTVKEVSEAFLNYYSIRPDNQILCEFIRDEYNSFTPEELNSPAYLGDTDRLLRVTAQETEYSIMKFNSEYWDRTKPKTSVQLVRLYYKTDMTGTDDDFFRDNGHPDYVTMFMRGLDLRRLGELLD